MFNISKFPIIYLKFILFDNELYIIAVDNSYKLHVVSIEKEEIIFSLQIEQNEIGRRESCLTKTKNNNILIKLEKINCKNENKTNIYYFKSDNKIIKIELTKNIKEDKMNCEFISEEAILFRNKEYELEKKSIKKIISLEEFQQNKNLISISYTK